jgi:transposase-like protein
MSKQKKPRRSRPKFTAKFKADTVRLVVRERLPIARAAADLDVSETSLRHWVQ